MSNRPDPGAALRRLFGGRLTPATKWLLLLELGLFVVYAFAGGPAFYRDHLALTPSRALPGLEVWQLVTGILFHVSGGALLGNLIGLFVIGPLMERPWGTRRFLVVFVVAGVVANLVAALVGLAVAPRQAMGGCGSSLVAMIVAFGFVYRRQRLLFFGLTPMRAEHLSLFFAGLIVLLTLLARDFAGLAAAVAAGVIGALAATERLRIDHLGDALSAWWRRVRRARLKRRYHVLQGGKGQPDEAPPTPSGAPQGERKRYLN